MSLAGCPVGPHEGTQHALGKALHEGPCPPPFGEPAPTDTDMRARAAALRAEADALEDQAQRTTRLYIAGPMTGLPDWNYPAFQKAARQLRAAGYDVLDPSEHELPQGHETPWEVCLRIALRSMLECDGVATLEGWPGSRGARLEVKTAREVGIPVTWVKTWLAEAARQTEEKS